MERELINSDIANSYVLDVLKTYLDLGNNATINTSLINGEVSYELNYTMVYKTAETKRIVFLKPKEYFMLLHHALNTKGYNNCFIKRIVNNKDIKYLINFSLTDNYRRK